MKQLRHFIKKDKHSKNSWNAIGWSPKSIPKFTPEERNLRRENHIIVCPNCRGSGKDKKNRDGICATCNGFGNVDTEELRERRVNYL